MSLPDLFSAEYYNQKSFERVRDARAQNTQFEEWDEARERYCAEKIEPLLQTYRQSDHDWFKSFSRRKGEVMHSSDLIFRLQIRNPHIFVQQQVNFDDDWGLYSSAMGRVQFLTGMPKGWLTEFSYALVDERDLPLEERRGWRTVVIYCLMKGAITWDQAILEFGEPRDGFNEQRWAEVTADFRHGGDGVVHRNIESALS